MELLFKGGNEFVRFVIDRFSKNLRIASSQTNYKLTPTNWSSLFDKGKEEIQEEIIDKLDDAEFKKTIITEMAKQGYILTKSD